LGGAGTQLSELDTPVYAYIARTLEDRIASGEYAAGSRLPSGAQLCSEFGVSPMTVRRALQVLRNQGLVTAKQGQGTFARSFDLNDSLFHLHFLGGQWLDDSADIRLLAASMTRADENVAARLAVPEGQMVIHLRRLISYDGVPAMAHTEYIIYDPRRPLVESQLQLTCLHAFLDPGQAHRFPRGSLNLTAVNLDPDNAATLDEPAGASALRLEHEFEDADATPVSWGWFLLRAGLFRLSGRVGSS
jgi:GntR family transcriptional regulator